MYAQHSNFVPIFVSIPSRNLKSWCPDHCLCRLCKFYIIVTYESYLDLISPKYIYGMM